MDLKKDQTHEKTSKDRFFLFSSFQSIDVILLLTAKSSEFHSRDEFSSHWLAEFMKTVSDDFEAKRNRWGNPRATNSSLATWNGNIFRDCFSINRRWQAIQSYRKSITSLLVYCCCFYIFGNLQGWCLLNVILDFIHSYDLYIIQLGSLSYVS